MNVRDVFNAHLAARGYTAYASQLAALERLQRLDEYWRAYKAQRSNALKKLIARPPAPRGVYLWGGVGRGKRFLMDAFFAARRLRDYLDRLFNNQLKRFRRLGGSPPPYDRGFNPLFLDRP